VLACCAVGLFWIASCYRHRAIGDGDADGGGDVGWTPVQNLALPVPAPNGADLLFVVDDSSSI
jgi:hypothetical protein